VGLVGAVIAGITGVLAAAFSKQVADEFKAWTPRLISAIVQCAVRRLREDQRDRYAEEWQSHIDETPGEIGKIIVGLGLLPAAWKLSRISPIPRAVQLEELLAAMRDADRLRRLKDKIPYETGKAIVRFVTVPAMLRIQRVFDEANQAGLPAGSELLDLINRVAAEEPRDPTLREWTACFENAHLAGFEHSYRERAAAGNAELSGLAAALDHARAEYRRGGAATRPREPDQGRG
jgi:hypothetical protein